MRGSKDQPARVQRSAALYKQAAALFLQALQEEPGNARAQANLGYCLWSTDDYAKAVVWYHKAAKQGHARAQSNLGVCYHNGQGVGMSYVKAMECWVKAAHLGNDDAQFRLGMCYSDGLRAPGEAGATGVTDMAKAVGWWRTAAENGHRQAQFNLSMCYFEGHGVGLDQVTAAVWCQKAADQGDEKALFQLGVKYQFGAGVPKDLEKAVDWYLKAAARPCKLADTKVQTQLRECYAAMGVATPLPKQLIEQAVLLTARAMRILRTASDSPQGVAMIEQAEAVLRQALREEPGNLQAQCELGFCLWCNGLPEDGVVWYRKSAQQGHAASQSLLSTSYSLGHGVSKDKAKEAEWGRKAGAQGRAVARAMLSRHGL